MATGILGQASLTAGTNSTIYTVPATTFSIVSVHICNRGTTTATVRLALASSATPTNGEYIEFDAQLDTYGTLERTGIVMNAGKLLVAYSNSSNVSVTAFGIETSTV